MIRVDYKEPKNNVRNTVFKGLAITLAIIVISDKIGDSVNIKWQLPIRIESRNAKNDTPQCPTNDFSDDTHIQLPVTTTEKTITPETNRGNWSGEASWYGASEDACLGCDPNFIMANGKKLDDTKMTLAFNRLPLGSFVNVTNTVTGKSQVAEVTDTGGFEPLGRIADLSLALKEKIGCSDLCDVTILEEVE